MSDHCKSHSVYIHSCTLCKLASMREQVFQLREEIAALKAAVQVMLNAQTDRWAAQTDHASFAANAVVVAAHDALAALLEEQGDGEAENQSTT